MTFWQEWGQKIQNLRRAVKLLVDSRDDVQVVITGSSSFTLANSVEEPLTGRKFEYKLFPLSYAELAKHFGVLDESKKYRQECCKKNLRYKNLKFCFMSVLVYFAPVFVVRMRLNIRQLKKCLFPPKLRNTTDRI